MSKSGSHTPYLLISLTNHRKGKEYIYKHQHCSTQCHELEVFIATTTLNITLNHAASQIIFDIVSSDNSIIIDSVANAQITPPSNTGLTWNMFTGVITPSRALASSLLDLIVSDQMCHNIVLPLVSKDSLNLGFEIWLNNKTYYRDYNVTVPFPNYIFLPGRYYRYQVSFNKHSIYMCNVNINDWLIDDETVNPLYP